MITAERNAVEFERQVTNLVGKGYPQIAGLSEEEFREQLAPLEDRLADLDIGNGEVPFLLVVSPDLVPAGRAVEHVEREGKRSVSVLEPAELERFTPIPEVELPVGCAYLLLDVDTGAATKNVTPNDALGLLLDEGRSPLTVEEGIALLTHFPALVGRNNGFSLLGSRCGDKRVTAWWLSRGAPKLGWCWAGNPHTWLGSASCGVRVGPQG